MRAAFALVLMIGMLLAGGAVYLTKGYLGQQAAALDVATEQSRRTGKLVQVYAARKAMAFGAPLTAADVGKVYVQEEYMPAGAFLVDTTPKPVAEGEKAPPPPAVLIDEDPKKPRYLMRSVEPFEILIGSRVTEPGQMASLTGKLGAGLRAFQIRVDGSGVQGFVMPDAYIDIYWTGSSDQGEVTRMIESAIRVIAVDGASGEGQMATTGDARTITVAATPEQVARLAQAQSSGRLNMSLVASSADAVSGLVEVNKDQLLGVVREEVVAAVEAPAPQVCTIKTRKGDAVVEVPIPCTN